MKTPRRCTANDITVAIGFIERKLAAADEMPSTRAAVLRVNAYLERERDKKIRRREQLSTLIGELGYEPSSAFQMIRKRQVTNGVRRRDR